MVLLAQRRRCAAWSIAAESVRQSRRRVKRARLGAGALDWAPVALAVAAELGGILEDGAEAEGSGVGRFAGAHHGDAETLAHYLGDALKESGSADEEHAGGIDLHALLGGGLGDGPQDFVYHGRDGASEEIGDAIEGDLEVAEEVAAVKLATADEHAAARHLGQDGSDLQLHLLGGCGGEDDAVAIANHLADRLVQVAAAKAHVSAPDEAPLGNDPELGDVAPDANDHAKGAVGGDEPASDGSGQGPVHQADATGACPLHGGKEGGPLDRCGVGGEGDDEAGHEESAPSQGTSDQLANHDRGGLMIGDDATADGEYDAHVLGGLVGHEFRLIADGEDILSAGGERDSGRFGQDEADPPLIDAGGAGAYIQSEIQVPAEHVSSEVRARLVGRCRELTGR